VNLARSEVVTFNDEEEQNLDVQKMAEIVLGVNGEHAILQLLTEYFL